MSIYTELEAKGVRLFRLRGARDYGGRQINPEWMEMETFYDIGLRARRSPLSEAANAIGHALAERWRARDLETFKARLAERPTPNTRRPSEEPNRDLGFAYAGPVFPDWAAMSATEHASAKHDRRRAR
jgi:hypothetical protein